MTVTLSACIETRNHRTRRMPGKASPSALAAFHAGAERTVDADSLEALRAETDRQEAIAQEAQAGQVVS